MGEDTKIEWCDHTFNATWGCLKVSKGCDLCYAEGLSKRYGHNIWGPAKTTPRRTFGDKHWHEPLKWDKRAALAGKRATVFCGSMSDIGEEHPDWVTERVKLVKLINSTPNLIWLLLTKRPENLRRLFDAACWEAMGWSFDRWLEAMGDRIWIGTSVEDQAAADKRIPHLLDIPAKIRFLSVEPLLGPVDLWGARYRNPDGSMTGAISTWAGAGVQWVIVGGESGAKARPMSGAWARRIRDDCKAAGVAFFFKQWGEHIDRPDPIVPGKIYSDRVGKKEAGRELDGQTWSQYPQEVNFTLQAV